MPRSGNPQAAGGLMKPIAALVGACAMLGLWSVSVLGQAPRAAGTAGAPTFTRDILPILQKSCQDCHHAGTSAPMSLMTYGEVRPWARAIKQKTARREMPPWHIDRSVGEYSPDPSLSDQQIARIGAWVDAGAPEGAAADAPPPRTFAAASEWTYGEPDLIVRMDRGF